MYPHLIHSHWHNFRLKSGGPSSSGTYKVRVPSPTLKSVCVGGEGVRTPPLPEITPIYIIPNWIFMNQPPPLKRHLDRFSRFCTVHRCDEHTYNNNDDDDDDV